jgi:hypothetical protein
MRVVLLQMTRNIELQTADAGSNSALSRSSGQGENELGL